MDAQTKALLKSLGNLLTPGELAYSAGIGAEIIAEEAKRRAPIGKTGNLLRGIVAKQNKASMGMLDQGKAYVGVNYGIAPHAHLVEFGARGGQMPAHPFIRPAIEAKKSEALAAISADITKRINMKMGAK